MTDTSDESFKRKAINSLPKGGNNPREKAWGKKHNIPHCLGIGKPQGLGCFHLTLINGLDACPDNLCYIRSAVIAHGDNSRRKGRHWLADRGGQPEIDKKKLHQEGCASNKVNINAGNNADQLVASLLLTGRRQKSRMAKPRSALR